MAHSLSDHMERIALNCKGCNLSRAGQLCLVQVTSSAKLVLLSCQMHTASAESSALPLSKMLCTV